MELQALLVLCGVGVVAVAVVLLMGLFSSSGTSFEEAIAQKRKAETELLANLAENKSKNNKKTNKKAIKKQAKKEKKESAAVSTGSDQESEAPGESGVEDEAGSTKGHVEFSPPVVVDIPRDTPPTVKIRKRGKDPKVKPILLNKEDPSCVSDPAAVAAPANIVNHFDETHPKDDFELLQSSLAAEKPQEKVEEPIEKKEVKSAKPKATKVAAPKPAPPTEAVKEERERRDSGDAPKEQRKAKKTDKKPEKAIEEVVETTREEVIPPLNAPQPSELTTEKLLKQVQASSATAAAPTTATATPPGGKKRKKNEPYVLSLMAGDSGGVNVTELLRVVREAALSRNEIQILTDTLLNKQHDPLPEHSEWTEGPNDPLQKLKKQLVDKEKALADEIEASQGLQAKLKELRGTLNAERTRQSAATRAAEATEAAAAAAARAEQHTLQTRLNRLLEENQALTQDKIMFQQKLAVEGEAHAQRVQLEMHLQRLSEAEASLIQQIAVLQTEIGSHAMEASAARDSCMIAQQHAAELAQQLQEANRAYSELEQQRQMAIHAEQHAQQELRVTQDRLAAMTELQNEVQRLSSRAQIAESNFEKVKEEAEKQKQQLSSEIASLSEQLADREAELAELKQLKAVPAQNGLPSITEQHKAELVGVQSVVTALREELSAAQRCSRDQRDQLQALQAQLDTYQDKNNELRTKNWKVMEALQSAEKALQSKASAMPAQDLREAISKAQEAQYSEVAQVLRGAWPASPAPASAAGREWLQAFADELRKELHRRDQEKQELEKKAAEKEIVELPDPRVAELGVQNEQLQVLIGKYKGIINETEGTLSRLQEKVSIEEQCWAQQFADKQRELDELRSRTVLQEPLAFAYSCIEKSLPAIVEELQSKIDSLELQLAQASTTETEKLAQLQIEIVALESQLAATRTTHNHSLESTELQSNIGALESNLGNADTTNHNHSFATAERLIEEKLMAGFEVFNGPSQVGLEKK